MKVAVWKKYRHQKVELKVICTKLRIFIVCNKFLFCACQRRRNKEDQSKPINKIYPHFSNYFVIRPTHTKYDVNDLYGIHVSLKLFYQVLNQILLLPFPRCKGYILLRKSRDFVYGIWQYKILSIERYCRVKWSKRKKCCRKKCLRMKNCLPSQ